MVTTASTSITQYLESEEVALSVVHVHRASLPVFKAALSERCSIVACLNTQRTIPKIYVIVNHSIFHVCPAGLVSVDACWVVNVTSYK